MSGYKTSLLFYLILCSLWFLLGSWTTVVPKPANTMLPQELISSPVSKSTKKKLKRKRLKGKMSKIKSTPPDYGERTQLSAFLLCLLLGFTGAHHFYMQSYKIAVLQLSFFVIFMALMFSNILIAVTFGLLIGIALFGWVMADVFILIFRGLRTGKKKQLIPWEGGRFGE